MSNQLKTEVKVIKRLLMRTHKKDDIKALKSGITAVLERLPNIEKIVSV